MRNMKELAFSNIKTITGKDQRMSGNDLSFKVDVCLSLHVFPNMCCHTFCTTEVRLNVLFLLVCVFTFGKFCWTKSCYFAVKRLTAECACRRASGAYWI